MAPEARHHNNFSPQIITNNREFVKNDHNYVHMSYANPFATTMGNYHNLNQEFVGLNNTMIQPQNNSMKAESGLTNNLPRKRSRDSMENEFNNSNVPLQGFESQNCANNMRHLLETDYILSQYSKKIKLEIAARQKQDARFLLASVRVPLMKKLKEKDEQILNMGKLNMALQERVKSLYVENQLWKDVANTNEATAMTLRHNLDNVLAHVSNLGFPANGAVADVEEAESCCGSNDSRKNKQMRTLVATADDGGNEAGLGRRLVETAEVGCGIRMCKKCGERESCVLLLPCRHLCLCSPCGASVQATCPVCNSHMNATVHVSLT